MLVEQSFHFCKAVSLGATGHFIFAKRCRLERQGISFLQSGIAWSDREFHFCKAMLLGATGHFIFAKRYRTGAVIWEAQGFKFAYGRKACLNGQGVCLCVR
ncbi:MAG: hypothetical protein IJ165_14575 [Proteobacteria bacterium]|nr:hypothetical protein [Pseudomonadota bacterium]